MVDDIDEAFKSEKDKRGLGTRIADTLPKRVSVRDTVNELHQDALRGFSDKPSFNVVGILNGARLASIGAYTPLEEPVNEVLRDGIHNNSDLIKGLDRLDRSIKASRLPDALNEVRQDVLPPEMIAAYKRLPGQIVLGQLQLLQNVASIIQKSPEAQAAAVEVLVAAIQQAEKGTGIDSKTLADLLERTGQRVREAAASGERIDAGKAIKGFVTNTMRSTADKIDQGRG